MKSLKQLQNSIMILDSGILKLIALISMLIDHIGAGLLLQCIRNGIFPFGFDFDQSKALYIAIRNIGRSAFPIYCFLLVEGLMHSRNVYKYMFNLGVFGVISEPFFDLAIRVMYEPFTLDIPYALSVNQERVLGSCNVYFTLLIGLIVIRFMKYVEDAGGKAYNGLKMLIYQAVSAYEIWNDVRVPEDVIRDIER